MPDVTGQQEAAATQALADQGLTNVATEEVESDQPAGTVLGSDPAPGNQVGAGTRITLQVSGGVSRRSPSPTSSVRPRRRRALGPARAPASPTSRTEPTTNDGTLDEGDVVNANPEPGTEVAPDEPIILLIAGPPADGG